MAKKKSNTPYYIIGFIVIFIGIILLINWQNSLPGKYDNFAQCLVDSEIKMYSAWWCGHCQAQKKDFGRSFKVIEDGGAHVECSPNDSKIISEFCKSEGITGTPSWKLSDETILRGRQSLLTLAQATGCTL